MEVLLVFNGIATYMAACFWTTFLIFATAHLAPRVWSKLGGWPALRMALRALLVFVVLYGTGLGLLEVWARLQLNH